MFCFQGRKTIQAYSMEVYVICDAFIYSYLYLGHFTVKMAPPLPSHFNARLQLFQMGNHCVGCYGFDLSARCFTSQPNQRRHCGVHGRMPDHVISVSVARVPGTSFPGPGARLSACDRSFRRLCPRWALFACAAYRKGCYVLLSCWIFVQMLRMSAMG